MFSKILVAYDDSVGAQRALELAVETALRNPGAELMAVAVEEHLPHYGATIGEYEEEQRFDEQRCRRWLASAQEYAAQREIAIRTEVRAGHAAQELLHAAESWSADLLVLGHSGHSAVWGRFLGSTVEKVSRHAQCSVLIAAPSQGRV